MINTSILYTFSGQSKIHRNANDKIHIKTSEIIFYILMNHQSTNTFTNTNTRLADRTSVTVVNDCEK